jgi:hypothetical protein
MGTLLLLPPGMSERVKISDHVTHNERGAYGQSMWTMAIEYPSADDGLDEEGL